MTNDAPVTQEHLCAMAREGKWIAGLTAYDAGFARILDAGGVDFVLVGDSLGMIVQGHANTQSVTVADMEYHTRCVARGVHRALVLSDMPYQSYPDPDTAVTNAKMLLDAGAQMVKLEACADQTRVVEALAQQEIPACAHLGLRPQSLERFEGVTRVGRDAEEARELCQAAQDLEAAGAQLLLLECVQPEVAAEITQQADVPVIGIGSGAHCDGQVLVLHDVLGLTDPIPRHARSFMTEGGGVAGAVRAYVRAVRSGSFP